MLVAAGIGVTALRSLLEDLPRSRAPVVLLRASRPEDLVLGKEVRELVRHRRGGSCTSWSATVSRPASTSGRCAGSSPTCTAGTCTCAGRKGSWPASSTSSASLGVPDEAIHHEAFAL